MGVGVGGKGVGAGKGLGVGVGKGVGVTGIGIFGPEWVGLGGWFLEESTTISEPAKSSSMLDEKQPARQRTQKSPRKVKSQDFRIFFRIRETFIKPTSW
jgi:hypothetical protein